MADAANPYSAPTSRVLDLEDTNASDAELIRRAHIKHEASVRSIGVLYYLAGGACLIGAAVLLIGRGQQPAIALFLAALAAIYLAAGWGIRALKSWGRAVGGVFSGIGLLAFPLGTLINGYILWLIYSAKGKMVFSAEYKGVITATPHVEYKTSIVVWIVLALIIVLLLGIVISSIV